MLIVVGQDQFIIEHIHGVYKCINQAFLKITVCWIAMTELLKPCRHLFAGQLWLLQFSSLDIHKDFFFSCFQLIKPLFGGRRENALLDCFQNVFIFYLLLPQKFQILFLVCFDIGSDIRIDGACKLPALRLTDLELLLCHPDFTAQNNPLLFEKYRL